MPGCSSAWPAGLGLQMDGRSSQYGRRTARCTSSTISLDQLGDCAGVIPMGRSGRTVSAAGRFEAGRAIPGCPLPAAPSPASGPQAGEGENCTTFRSRHMAELTPRPASLRRQTSCGRCSEFIRPRGLSPRTAIRGVHESERNSAHADAAELRGSVWRILQSLQAVVRVQVRRGRSFRMTASGCQSEANRRPGPGASWGRSCSTTG